MRTGRQQVTLPDLVDEAKKRNVFLFVCSVGLSYLMSYEKKGLKLIDSPLSCGVKRASEGSLTIMESCADEALEHAGSVLSALSEKLYVIKGGCGAGVHIAYAAEVMALIWSSIGIGYKNWTQESFLSTKDGEGTSWYNHYPALLVVIHVGSSLPC
ncbi:putative 6-phosphogluconate dehydrogenase, NADP-binding, NAD(P)-binding domain superfamily [Helianthus anomalus]